MALSARTEELTENNHILSQQSVADMEELSTLRQRVAQLNDYSSQQKKQIEDISKRLSEERYCTLFFKE
jgi:predicted  nucleic acid-binding Zn-ribbon protein